MSELLRGVPVSTMLDRGGRIDQGDAEPAVPGLAKLWAVTRGRPEICVAILDGPVDSSHPAFAGARLEQLPGLSGVSASRAAVRHGTHVASVVFAQHSGPVKGVAPGCRGVIVPIFHSAGEGGALACSQLDLARAIGHAVQAGAHVINISAGQLDASGEPEPVLAAAVRRCFDRGILLVAAAGNDGCECVHIPAVMPEVLAVGAADAAGSPLGSSNWGGAYLVNGVLAPGKDILGATPGGGVARASGTSFAAPLVSGAIALLLSIQIEQGRKLDPSAVRRSILSSAFQCDQQIGEDCRRVLAGRLDLAGAYARLTASEPVEKKPMNDEIHASSTETGGASDPAPRAAQSAPGAAPSAPAQGSVVPSGGAEGGCGCGAKATPPSLCYVLGEIGVDFPSEARRDALTQLIGGNPADSAVLLAHLAKNPWDSTAVTWVLYLDGVAVYAIQPSGPYASVAYDRLREFLADQIANSIERVSIPGILAGSTKLLNGQQVPVLWPEVRGMCSWSTKALVHAAVGPQPSGGNTPEQEAYEQHTAEVGGFLERVYYELRNPGVMPEDRAMNFAATNAFQAAQVFRSAIQNKQKLDSITVERSPMGRVGSDTWDVKLTLFNPMKRIEEARVVHRLTVDVSDTVPVTVGKTRSWHVY